MSGDSGLEVRPSWGRRLIGIEGLRGIAAIMVLIGHVKLHLAAGVNLSHPVSVLLSLLLNGLTLFFALSGFLLFRPFATALVTGDRCPSLTKYFRNRILRVYPAYIVILLIVSVAGVAYARAATADTGLSGVSGSLGRLSPGLFFTDLTMLHTIFPFSIKTGLGVSWSLTVELIFYIVMPIVTLAVWKVAHTRSRKARLVLATVPAWLLLTLGLIGREITTAIRPVVRTPEAGFYYNWGSNWHAVLARSFFSQADLFAFGMLAAVGIVMIEHGVLAGRALQVARAAALVLVVVGVAGGRHFPATSDTWWALGCAAIIFVVAAPGSTPDSHSLLARTLELLPFRYVGLVSYSMYLWHEPVLWFMQRHGMTANATPRGFVINIFAVFAVTLALSSITYFGVEKPAMKFKAGVRAQRDRSTRTPQHAIA